MPLGRHSVLIPAVVFIVAGLFAGSFLSPLPSPYIRRVVNWEAVAGIVAGLSLVVASARIRGRTWKAVAILGVSLSVSSVIFLWTARGGYFYAMSPDGELIAVADGYDLYLYRKDGSLLWKKEGLYRFFEVTKDFVAVADFMTPIQILSIDDGEVIWQSSEAIYGYFYPFFYVSGRGDIVTRCGKYFSKSLEPGIRDPTWTTDKIVLGISDDGDVLATGWYPGQPCYLLSGEDGSVITEFPVSGVTVGGISRDGSYVVLCGYYPPTSIKVFSRDGRLLWESDLGIWIYSIVVGRDYFVVTDGGRTFFFNKNSPTPLWKVNIEYGDFCSISDDGMVFFCAWKEEYTRAFLFTKDDNIPIFSVDLSPESHDPARVAMSRDGDYIVFGSIWGIPTSFCYTKFKSPRAWFEPTISTMPEGLITLKWAGVKHADHYIIQLSESPDFLELVENYASVENHISLRFTAGTYYWRVKAVFDGVETSWSATNTLHVTAPIRPPIPPRLEIITIITPVGIPIRIGWGVFIGIIGLTLAISMISALMVWAYRRK